MIPKPSRLASEYAINSVKKMKCVCCQRTGNNDAHHITTVKAGGADTFENLMPLCREHHTEIHKIGYRKMCEKYPFVRTWLAEFGRHDILEKMERV